MIIKHVNNSETNTDKLDDISAIILEKAEELRKICDENCRPAIIIVDASYERGKHSFFWSSRVAGAKPENNKEDAHKCYSKIMSLVNTFVKRFSQGTCSIQRVSQEGGDY